MLINPIKTETAIREFLQRGRGRTRFLEHEVKGLLRSMGLPVPSGVFVPKGAELSSAVLSYPLVAKVSSGAIASKSDVGGVRTGIKDGQELKKAVDELFEIKDAEGVLVEEMAQPGTEVIVGGVIDKQFGPVVMFGLGGIFVELFKDVAFGLAPMKEEDALGILQQVKGYRLIEGYRGHPPADIPALIRIVVSVSEVIGTGAVEEIDLNPVVLYPEGAMILDAKLSAVPAQPESRQDVTSR